MNSFSKLGLSAEIISGLTELGYKEPTAIQLQSIPKVLSGNDLIAKAQTGTGKTAAYVLPSLERLKKYLTTSVSPAMHPVRMLILSPTRELAIQIYDNVCQISKYLPFKNVVIYGGSPFSEQQEKLRSGNEIVVATVGRLLEHLEHKNITLDKVEILVLDEADRMLDMGFIEDIRHIISLLPSYRQFLLFSATFPKELQNLVADFMKDYSTTEVAAQNTISKNIEQHIIAVDKENKLNLLERLILDLVIEQSIIFCKTKTSVEKTARFLNNKNIKALSLHSDKTQKRRIEILNSFKNKEIQALVATDIVARGLDIEELPFVINYEMPHHAEDYVHRIGRTGRADSQGVAISLMDKSDYPIYDEIIKIIKTKIKIEKIKGFEPNWLEKESTEKKPKNSYQKNNLKNKHGDDPNKIKTKNPLSLCDPIPNRRSNRLKKEVCALLLTNFGIKSD